MPGLTGFPRFHLRNSSGTLGHSAFDISATGSHKSGRKPEGWQSAAVLGSAMKNIVYFDLETQKSAEEVGGWDHISRMGMSIGVTYSTAQDAYRIYGEKQVSDLLTDLQRADLVVGFNNLRFDYEVLHGYTSFDLRQLPTLDMMVDLQTQLKHRLSLDSIATATFGVEKTAEGLQAIQWFKEGKLLEIAEYCCYDVKITRLVHEFGVQHRQLHYHNRFGKKMTVPVKW
jgi:DEAD/DEAH box helicase domain-containing protein